MAREPALAFQFYPKDFLSDEKQAAMSVAEAGVYIRLLSICWLERSIPDDVRLVSRMVGASPYVMQRLWPAGYGLALLRDQGRDGCSNRGSSANDRNKNNIANCSARKARRPPPPAGHLTVTAVQPQFNRGYHPVTFRL